MQLTRKGRTASRTILRYQPTRLVPNPASIAQSLWPHGSSTPLRGLFSLAVLALPPKNGTWFATPCSLFGRTLLRGDSAMALWGPTRPFRKVLSFLSSTLAPSSARGFEAAGDGEHEATYGPTAATTDANVVVVVGAMASNAVKAGGGTVLQHGDWASVIGCGGCRYSQCWRQRVLVRKEVGK